jgi:hypothetical protein
MQKGFSSIILILGIVVIFAAVSWKLFVPLNVNKPVVFNDCSTASNYVISQKKLDKVQQCVEKRYTVDKKDIYFVDITYGEPQDCPAGCIYQGYTGLVEGNKITDFPSVTLDLVNDSIATSKSEICSLQKLGDVTLVKVNDIYKWKIAVDQPDNTLCTLKGSILLGSDGMYDYSQIVDSTPALDCENPVTARAACMRKNAISGVSCDTEEQIKNACLYFKASSLSKLAICDQIVNNTDLTDLCYYSLAVKLHDRSICDKRTLGIYYKNNCEQYSTR